MDIIVRIERQEELYGHMGGRFQEIFLHPIYLHPGYDAAIISIKGRLGMGVGLNVCNPFTSG